MNSTDVVSFTLSELLTRLTVTEAQALIVCDSGNRSHSQEWLIYSYPQTGRYKMSMDVLNDLIQAHTMLPSKAEHVGHWYSVQGHRVIEGFF